MAAEFPELERGRTGALNAKKQREKILKLLDNLRQNGQIYRLETEKVKRTEA